jgi:periplasmic divalent cation tolerance protein
MKKTNGYIVIYATFPDKKTAQSTIKGLIKAGRAACGSIFKIASLFIWKGKLEHAIEYGAFIKTTNENYRHVENYIRKHHPYEVPEIVSWDIKRGSQKYLNWIRENTT